MPEPTPAAPADNGAAPAAPETGQQQGGDDYGARLEERLNGVTQTLSQISERLPERQEPEPEGDDDDIEAYLEELGLTDRQVDDDGDEDAENFYELSPRDLASLVDRMVEKGVESKLSPHLDALSERDERQAYEALEQAFPEFQEKETQDKVLDVAAEVAQQTGDQSWLDPMHLMFVYKSMMYDEHNTEQESPASGRRDEGFERPTGANPASAQAAPEDEGDAIVRARGSSELREAGLI